jgi:hypothetical protein
MKGMGELSSQPESCAIAFKEWAGVCDALVQGRQSIILRKGGISEGSGTGAFVPEHAEFWLYPTGVHQAQQGLRPIAEDVAPVHQPGPDGSVPILALARVELIGYVRNSGILPALEMFHVLTAETILKRFTYRTPGLWVLGARIWRRDSPFAITATPEHAGCKTWVVLDPARPTTGLIPVLDDPTWAARSHHLGSILEDADPGRASA